MAFSAEEKLKIVLEGLAKENSITELCEKYNIFRQTYYDWKEQLVEVVLNNWILWEIPFLKLQIDVSDSVEIF